MPSKRRPLAEVQENGRLHHLKRRKISEVRNSLSSKSYGPPTESSAFPLHNTPGYLIPDKAAEPVSPDPATEKDPAQSILQQAGFEPPVVEFQAVKGKSRQRISARDLPGLPQYNPVEVPFEPHTARVSNL